MKKTTLTYAMLALAAAAATAAVFASMRGRSRQEADPASAQGLKQRPGAVYGPSVMPLRHANRPDITPSKRRRGGADAGSAGSGGGEEPDTEVFEVEIPVPIRPDDPNMAGFAAERDFAESVWSIMENEASNIVDRAMSLLASDIAADRAKGGVLLALSNVWDEETIDAIIWDEEPGVPFTVLDWLRDFSSEEEAAVFKKALSARGISREDMFSMALNSNGAIGGGRSALDLWLEGFSSANPADVDSLAALAVSPEASYDVREQALFKLLEPETQSTAMQLLGRLAEGFQGGESPLSAQAARKLATLAEISNPDGEDEKIWDSEAPVVFYMANSEAAFPARDLANYLEYALRRDDPEYPPIIEEGTWEFANDFMEKMQQRRDSLLPEEQEALDRIAVQLDHLVEYDPAFNPFETVEDDGDEPDDDGDDDSGGEEPDEEDYDDGDGEDDEPDDDEDDGEPDDEDDGEPDGDDDTDAE